VTPPAPALTERQAEVFAFVAAYHALTHKPCPTHVVADRFRIHHEAVRGHFAALCRKGWLDGETSPPTPRAGYLTR
jgi:predicted ArsR family transcriptional regulator